MRTAAYKVDVASDRRRRENVPCHILYSEFIKIVWNMYKNKKIRKHKKKRENIRKYYKT